MVPGRELPILFSTPMVQAIDQELKDITRRVVKYKKIITDPTVGFTTFTPERSFSVRGTHENGQYGESFFKLPYCKGDIIWVRETFLIRPDDKPEYRANYSYSSAKAMKWKPNIFMRKEHARFWLEVVSVRAERLHKITNEDAIREGVERINDYGETGFMDYLNPESSPSDISPRHSFETLWMSINGKESWEPNPWVWRIEFKVLSKTGRPENLCLS